MSPKEKANKIANNMYNGSVFSKTKKEHLEELENAKRCSLILIEEILSINNERMYQLTGVKESFYKEVRQEINNL